MKSMTVEANETADIHLDVRQKLTGNISGNIDIRLPTLFSCYIYNKYTLCWIYYYALFNIHDIYCEAANNHC